MRTSSRHAEDFIHDESLSELLDGSVPSDVELAEVIDKSLSLKALSVEETALLLRATGPGQTESLFAAARALKQRVYGNRVVLFAPLYVGNLCVNDCTYCAFRRSNPAVQRSTLGPEDLRAQVTALENVGHKRLILVFGEHASYDAETIATCVEEVYRVKSGHGEIRRVNINAAPMEPEGFARLHAAGIGTFQIFQETYHHETYASVHPKNTRKGDYLYRLDGPGRAIDAGQDDVGIGALFGLYDWRFEVLALVSHAIFLQTRHGVGPHTISVPRLRPALGVHEDTRWQVSDDEMKRIIAILRLAVPYTGLILTAREPAALRREALAMGVSQIDGGSRIDIGGYTRENDEGDREQFILGDNRSLDEVIGELARDGYLPSFCTACYRLGRTGEHFMEFAVPGFIKRYCTPNAICTLAEYLHDYASDSTRATAQRLLDAELGAPGMDPRIRENLRRISTSNERDFCF